MQLVIGIGIVCGVLLGLAVVDLVHLAMEHLMLVSLCALIGLPVLVLAGRALGRGMLHHTAVTWNVLPPAAPRRELPAPVRSVVIEDGVQHPGGAFSAELAGAPEEHPCEGPGCGEMLGEMTWTVDAVTQAEGEDSVAETHSFCSRPCAEQYALARELETQS